LHAATFISIQACPEYLADYNAARFICDEKIRAAIGGKNLLEQI